MKRFMFALAFVVSVTWPHLAAVPSVAASSSLLVISQVQTGGIESAGHEFVELHNTSILPVVVTGWKVVYSTGGDTSPKDLVTFTGQVPARGFVLVASSSYPAPSGTVVDAVSAYAGLAAGGGHIRLYDAANQEMDKLGWGTATQAEGTAVLAPAAGKSMQRLAGTEGTLVDTNHNAADFAVRDTPNPQGGGLQPVPVEPPATPPSNPGTPPPALSCDGAIISELLPNPASSDTGHEFIEVHNPMADIIDLAGCTLHITGATKTFTFPANTSLQAGEYRAFSDTETGLILPNAAGGEVVLGSATTDYPVTYPGGMKDDESWALVGSVWQATNRPTPSEANLVSVIEATGGSGGGDQEVSGLTPCPPGKFRNPATNRCNTSESEDDLVPCLPGQTRNPETNRCRSIVAASATLTPCKEGQERNAETNRCRSVAASSTSHKPCNEGEERNPETNRCRKITKLASAGAKGESGNSTTSAGKASLVALGLVGTAALSYGAYEYRQDFFTRLTSLKSRFFAKSSSK